MASSLTILSNWKNFLCRANYILCWSLPASVIYVVVNCAAGTLEPYRLGLQLYLSLACIIIIIIIVIIIIIIFQSCIIFYQILPASSCWQKKIEDGRKHLCSVVYGSLPPQTRTRQVFASSFFTILLRFLWIYSFWVFFFFPLWEYDSFKLIVYLKIIWLLIQFIINY